MNRKSCYARAGVDIDQKMSGLAAIKKLVDATSTSGVLGGIGAFGGMFASPGRDKVLVASTDGVGTKLKVALMAGCHSTVGQDIVNHCVNDILVQGATPLFFLDYIGTSKFQADAFRNVIAGLCKACRENGCALLGGETAEMPGLYPPNEYDLVGTIVGVVDRRKIITGSSIRPGDMVIGLPSTGLHTNGYSLARKVIFETAGLKVGDIFPGTDRTVADVLLAVHRSYLRPVLRVMEKVRIRGMAHITGGGFYDNIPRVLPAGTAVIVNANSWQVPPWFDFIAKKGGVGLTEMYRVFNMGIGYVLIVKESDADKAMRLLRTTRAGPVIIGEVVKGARNVSIRW